ncbi:hypothetical protein PIB30_096849, partial [Stylosanthes scabra]|nr:hypothetical protein [Stylosanthes scabra]
VLRLKVGFKGDFQGLGHLHDPTTPYLKCARSSVHKGGAAKNEGLFLIYSATPRGTPHQTHPRQSYLHHLNLMRLLIVALTPQGRRSAATGKCQDPGKARASAAHACA